MYFKRIYQRVWWKEWQWKGTFESGYLLPITFKEKKSSRMFGIAVMSFFLAQMIAGSSPVGIIFIFILFCVEESGHLFVLRKFHVKESFTIFSLTQLIEWKCPPEDFNQRIWKAKFDKILSFLKFKEQEKSSSQKHFPFLWKCTQSLGYFY